MDASNPAEATATNAATDIHQDDASGHAPRPGIAPHAVPRPWRKRFRLPIKIADGYLLVSVFEATLRGLIWFAGLLASFAVITAVRKVVADQLPVSVVFKLVAYQMPRVFLFTLPISVLYGTVQTFTDLSSRGELTALGVGGMSLPRMVRAPLVWGAMVAILAFWLQEAVVPQAERENRNVLLTNALNSQTPQNNFRMNDLGNDSRTGRIVMAEIFIPKTRQLINPRIVLFNEDQQVGLEIIADEAKWDIAKGKWVFYQGRSRFTPRIESTQTSIGNLPTATWMTFTQLDVDALPDPKFMDNRARTMQSHLEKKSYEMLSISDLRNYLDKQPKWLAEVVSPQLKDEIRRRISSLTFGIHDKIATPLVCLAVILIGAPLGVRPQRSASAGIAMGLSLATLLIYYVVWSWISQIGKGGLGNPYMLAYTPLTIILVISAILMKIKSR